jgi:hypothetical protein
VTDPKLAALTALAQAIAGECAAEQRLDELNEALTTAIEHARTEQRDAERIELAHRLVDLTTADVNAAERRAKLASNIRREIEAHCKASGYLGAQRKARKGAKR